MNFYKKLRSGRDFYFFKKKPIHKLYAVLLFFRSLNRSLFKTRLRASVFTGANICLFSVFTNKFTQNYKKVYKPHRIKYKNYTPKL